MLLFPAVMFVLPSLCPQVTELTVTLAQYQRESVEAATSPWQGEDWEGLNR